MDLAASCAEEPHCLRAGRMILGYIGIMEEKMETTGDYRDILVLFRDNGKENGNYYLVF